MSQKPGKSERNSLPSPVETAQSLSQRLMEVVKSQPESNNDLELLHLAEMLVQATEQLAADSVDSGLSRFKQELEQRDEKIHEFKISLADSVIEFKGAQKELQAAHERNSALATQVSQMQLHSKEITLKLSSATANLEAREAELETLRKEVMELRSRVYQLKSANAEYESHLHEAGKSIEHIEREHASASATRDKALRDLEHVITSNKELKKSLELFEIKEKELIDTVDALQKERNHLQGRLSSLLTGLNKTVEYHLPQPSTGESPVLEPAMLPPYLPFCFPERMPSVIKFRREIGKAFPAAFSRRQPQVPRTFTPPVESAPPTEAIRTVMKRPRIRPVHMADMKLVHKPVTPAFPTMNFSKVRQQYQSSVLIGGRQDMLAAMLADKMPFRWWKAGRSLTRALRMSTRPAFSVSTWSLELYLRYLATTFVRQNFRPSEAPLQHDFKWAGVSASPDALNFSNIFNEMLAFRHRFQLKSQKLEAPQLTLTHSFLRGNKLKSVLETFGNTISSMVQKYEIIPTSQTGNGENVK